MNLASGPVRLRFEKIVEVEPGGQLVPFYHFRIIDPGDNDVGHINLRVGDTRHVNLVAGHVGYEVAKEFRGHAYSFHACRALRPLIRKHYEQIILTVAPENIPSIKIIERLGAKFIDEIDVPTDDPAYASGARRKRRYEWAV